MNSISKKWPTSAAEWFVLKQQQAADDEQQNAFEHWLAQANNAEAYWRYQSLWALTSDIEHEPAITEFKQASLNASKPQSNFWFNWQKPMALSVMSALTIGFVIVFLINIFSNTQTYETAVGEQRRIELVDGSEVILNTNTRLHVNYQRAERKLILEKGEAVFKVAHAADRPFSVHVGDRFIKALGTRFNILHTATTTTVSVLEGRVGINTARNTKGQQTQPTLSAGQAISYQPQGKLSSIEEANIEHIQAWLKGELHFDNLPLAAAATELNRYAQKPIVIKDNSLKTIQISGVFEIGNTQAFMIALRRMFDINTEETPEMIILSSRKPYQP